MKFNFNIDFKDFNSVQGILKIDKLFCKYLLKKYPYLYERLNLYRNLISKNQSFLEQIANYSGFIIDLGKILEEFLSQLFYIEKFLEKNQQEATESKIISECKKFFIQRYVLTNYSSDILKTENIFALTAKLEKILKQKFVERDFAQFVVQWIKSPEEYTQELDIAARFSAYMIYSGSEFFLFQIPQKISDKNYISTVRIEELSKQIRLGFTYRGDNLKIKQNLYLHANYCIFCHKAKKDSCSKGLSVISAKYFDSDKTGCPLEQKISEMNYLASWGIYIGALAVIMIDNPLVVLTGDRICNDCQTSCIYQKQEPVNVPGIESNILNKVLSLPYGLEIYLLLSRWNPLNLSFPYPKEDTGYNVLIAGLGPAGIAISHYLLNLGHRVVGIDCLSILSQKDMIRAPIKHWKDFVMKKDLLNQEFLGIGGVAEYGITNRWSKEKLIILHILLFRRKNFAAYGSIRLGSNITIKNIFNMGFDHIAISIGSGKPSVHPLLKYSSNNVRTANEILMLFNERTTSNSEMFNPNLLIRLPVVVIGCGLTAIDVATEIIHYYPIQVKNFVKALRRLNSSNENFTIIEKEIIKEFIEHENLLSKAQKDQEVIEMIKSLGGVKIIYYSSIEKSSAYRQNFYEIEHAISIGIIFEEHFTLKDVIYDQNGILTRLISEEGCEINCKMLISAVGTQKNEFLDIKNNFSQNLNSTFFKNEDSKISYLGDCNTNYSGSVVRALANAKKLFPHIHEALISKDPTAKDTVVLESKFSAFLTTYVKSITQVSEYALKMHLYSPSLVQNYKIGQFFKLQAIEEIKTGKKRKFSKPVALSAFDIDMDNNILTFLLTKKTITINEICLNDRLFILGPTGGSFEKRLFLKETRNKTIILIGYDMGIVSLHLLGKMLALRGYSIIFFLGYPKIDNMFCIDEYEQISQKLFVSVENTNDINSLEYFKLKHSIKQKIYFASLENTIKDLYIKHNLRYASRVIFSVPDKLISPIIDLQTRNIIPKEVKLDYIHIIPKMYCMSKGVCGACIQRTKSSTGKKNYIFTCINQYYDANKIDLNMVHSNSTEYSTRKKIKNIERVITGNRKNKSLSLIEDK